MFLTLNVTNLTRRQLTGTLVGYSGVSKAYKIYHPQTGKMTITRNVHFSENEFSEIRRMTSGTGAVEALQEPK